MLAFRKQIQLNQ